jgi:hypothetical protein
MKKPGQYKTQDGFMPVAGEAADFTWRSTGFTLIDERAETDFLYVIP